MREKGCHNRKQTERSYQIFIHFAGWWRSTFFALFYFSLPVISKISLCGRTFWHGTTAPTTRRLTTDKRSTKRAANNPASTSCKVTYWPIKTRARVLEGHFLALYYNLPHGKVPPFLNAFIATKWPTGSVSSVSGALHRFVWHVEQCHGGVRIMMRQESFNFGIMRGITNTAFMPARKQKVTDWYVKLLMSVTLHFQKCTDKIKTL